MKILEIIPLENCIDGSPIYEVRFDHPITPGFIAAWKSHGELRYYPEFTRPFFSLQAKGAFHLKGVEGKASLRLNLQSHSEESLDLFRKLCQKVIQEGYSDIKEE